MDRTTTTTKSGIARAGKSPCNRSELIHENSRALKNRWSWIRRFELWARWGVSFFFQRRKCTRPFRIPRGARDSALISEQFIPVTPWHAAALGISILIAPGLAWATICAAPIWPMFRRKSSRCTTLRRTRQPRRWLSRRKRRLRGIVSAMPESVCRTTKFDKSEALQERARALIPGGAHVYAKGEDQFPLHAPGFIERGQGCHVWDVDGNEFIEYGMGLRAVSLGHGYRSVAEAAHRRALLGLNFTRPSPIEIECAEMLAGLIPSTEMVKFSKNGSDVTTAAVKLARAYTGRDMVAVCGDQPFFSVDDWFIGSTPLSAGVPKVTQDLTVKFQYNNLAN